MPATVITHLDVTTDMNSLASEEEEVEPEPGEDQHDDGNGEAEDEPCAEVDNFCFWITTAGGNK